jgi:MoaA/NifB/PqqE/SkfB family radical SAM enzyme
MIEYKEIRDVHLEISTLCNASCPWCPRNFWGYPYNGGYPELNLTLINAKKIFQEDFVKQLTSIRINGNFGDIVMNPESPDIIEYFRYCNSDLKILISTNGSARNKTFWQKLAKENSIISFALDGLIDTHYLYRQNTQWSTIIKNASLFIAAGGHAIWKMIRFDHNAHQVQECRELAKTLGFKEFQIVDQGRNVAPVFDNRGSLTHTIGGYNGEKNFKVLFHKKQTDQILLEDIVTGLIPKKNISCETKRLNSIYIAANGDVSPCCFTGFYPATYGHGQYHQAANLQLIPLIEKNNALEFSLSECINWFSNVEKSWAQKSYQDGRLIICDNNCGNNF